jgi:DNA repair exonuclease SbcCD nuclease subunit
MSLLVTADFQAEFNNLDLCEQAWNEILDICKERHLKYIAVCGDLKQNYNPIDGRVTIWWQHAIRKAKKNGYSVLVLLGNHDRFGQYSNADNWLPILRRAGAITYDTPGVKNIGERRLFLLPFSGVDSTRRNARELLRENPKRDLDILLFHGNLLEARYSQHGQPSDSFLSCGDLHHDRYLYCIGGDIHLPQRIEGNVYYTGSPFCTNWGEVNQRKRYIVVGNKGEITSIHSNIPRWFDPNVNGFNRAKPKRWIDARIRIQVSCDASKDYGRALERARRKAEKKYKGAAIFVVPRFREGGREYESSIRTNDSDERKITQYVLEMASGRRIKQSDRLIKYMLEKLSHFSGGLRTESKVKFLYAKGTNFLSFKKVKLDFEKGITVIQGINYDRNKKSNGSGKTGLVQLLPVCYFGKTFKDQTSDHWANRWVPKESALVEVGVRTDHHTIKTIRGRRPPLLQMIVDGKDKSSGMKSNDRKGTQAQIEQKTGFSWQTLANAVYIDRSIADAFLSGTKKERTDVLSRFQNLERFEKALLLVKGDIKHNDNKKETIGRRLENTRGRISGYKTNLSELQALRNIQLDGSYKTYQRALASSKKWNRKNKPKIFTLESKARKIEKKYQKYAKKLEKVEDRYVVMEADANRLKRQIDLWHKLQEKGNCPMCGQIVNEKWMTQHTIEITNELKDSELHLNEQLEYRSQLRKKVYTLEAIHTEIETKLSVKDSELKQIKLELRTAEDQYNELFKDQHHAKNILGRVKDKLKVLLKQKKELKQRYKKLQYRDRLYKYAMEAFSRDGIPAFLNRQLAPVLNKAASYYAEIFTDSEIQVKFPIEHGEIVPQVININGGEDIKDQSKGELAIAGLIGSFALREIAPKCNVLILDEPGDGLDDQTAKQFANGLRKLVSRFGSIYVTTFNDHILSELSGERLLTVEKRNKISRVI